MVAKKVLYITTQLTGSHQYFSWCSYPDIWYTRIQRKILSLLNERSDIDLSLRFYPNDLQKNPNIEWAQREFTDLEICKESLEYILIHQNFDLIITEASATTLLEIICTKSSILAFIPQEFIKLSQSAKLLLQKRVYLAETLEDYYKKLDVALTALDSRDNESFHINDDFLFTYGLPSLEEDPLNFTKQAIESIYYNVLSHG